jgi:hypothetical protein
MQLSLSSNLGITLCVFYLDLMLSCEFPLPTIQSAIIIIVNAAIIVIIYTVILSSVAT